VSPYLKGDAQRSKGSFEFVRVQGSVTISIEMVERILELLHLLRCDLVLDFLDERERMVTACCTVFGLSLLKVLPLAMEVRRGEVLVWCERGAIVDAQSRLDLSVTKR